MSLLLLALYYYGLLVSAQHITLPCSGATVDTIPRGRALAGDERLVSGNGKFALGFFQTGGNNKKSSSSSKSNNNTTRNSYLGIWFHRITKLTPVWTANGNSPIPSLASPELTISGDGNLVLLAQDKIVWSTRANITTGASDTVAVLLGNGNLVLRSSSNSSDVFWQSFDYPTDTLLSGAKIGLNKITGLNRRIVSRKSTVDQSSGAYSAELAHRAIHILWKSSVVYWSSGEWNDRSFSSIPEMAARNSGPYISNYTFVDNEQEVYFSYTLLDETMIFHNFVGPSGQMQTNIWSDVAQDWTIAATQPKDPCDVYATCGPFTICANHGDATCNCMKGFSVRSPEEWEHQDRTGGCIRHSPLNCDGGGGDGRNKTGMTTDKFYSVPSIRLPQNARRIQNASSANGCAQACLSNCTCTAYSYGVGGCSVWHGELLNVAADDNGDTLYLRLAAEELPPSSKCKMRGVIIGVAVGATTVTAVGFIALLITAIWKRRIGEWTRSRTVDNDNQRDIGIISFRYIDLERATKNFSEKIGEGGFGSVFKGCLWDASAIAVKRLVGASQGEKQFRAEVNSIGIVRHINLVELIGYCCDGGRRLLVYEYMSNGSLDALLFQNQCRVLDWTIRYQIALGVARGLAYLHHGCRDCIIHCDIKPQNILLDTSFVPKIADFGMAKFLGRDFSRVVTTTRGTIGYLAPEWISGTAITSKVDVYSYGMVLLEIISGRRNNDNESSHDGDHTCYFPVQVAHKLLDGDVESILDGNLNGDVNLEEVERVCKIACWCIQDNEFDRPNMSEVVHFLEGVLEPEIPPVPRLLDAITRGSYLA